jgi:phage baseplate assembly protein W
VRSARRETYLALRSWEPEIYLNAAMASGGMTMNSRTKLNARQHHAADLYSSADLALR